jgi:L-alanine-DL-glutamate epimerase-like enolase superfamily enzyme
LHDLALSRRSFLAGAAAAVLAAGFGDCRLRSGCSAGPRIRRVSSYALEAPRWKPIGRNARAEDHGRVAKDTLLRIETDAGVEGIGPSWGTRRQAAGLLGRRPLELYRPGVGPESSLGGGDAPLWDLVGRLLDTPVWRLLGGEGPEWVPVYDGSFYFSDLDPAFSARGVDRILEEVDHSLALGHRALKLKIGRGYRWMEPEEGLRRDVEVVRRVRRHVGPGVRLMVDANDGYDLATAKRFLDEADVDLTWVEEMFPEAVEADLELKAWLRERGRRTLVADGESAADPSEYAPFIEARALDVLQGNIHVFGLRRFAELSRTTAPVGISLAPNNWGSFLGLHLELVLGRGVRNLLMAEQDPGVTDAVDVTGFELREGRCRVPDAPGCGWMVSIGRLERSARLNWRVE